MPDHRGVALRRANGAGRVSTWIIGGLVIAIASGVCWLVYEFVNAPLCGDDDIC